MLYNTRTISLSDPNFNQYKLDYKSDFAPHFFQLLNTTGQEIFSDIYASGIGIPFNFLNPAITMTNNILSMDLTKYNQKYYSTFGMFSPLNITLQNLLPYCYLFNSYSYKNIMDFIMMQVCRIPIIICKSQNETYVVNLYDISPFGQFNFANKWYYNNNNNLRNYFVHMIEAIWMHTPFNYDNNNQRIINDNMETNVMCKALYNNGQFVGAKYPQNNDFFVDMNNLKSNFNNCSLLKCVLQIAHLSNVYNSEAKCYTLDNGFVVVVYTWDQNNGHNLKFTGKYWKKSMINISEIGLTTDDIIRRLVLRIYSDANLRNDIASELDTNVNNLHFDYSNNRKVFQIGYRVQNQYNFGGIYAFPWKNIKNYYNITLGIDDDIKFNFALMNSGMQGHFWDTVGRYFNPDSGEVSIEKELTRIKEKFPDCECVKHFGSILAGYLYDFREGVQDGMLGGYNSLNFNRCITNNIISCKARMTGIYDYKPNKVPNAIFVVCYNNCIVSIKTKCYRSYKALMKLMKTRKQRDYLFSHLTQYGRRAMTVLDPYGIFMHFNNKEALAPQ